MTETTFQFIQGRQIHTFILSRSPKKSLEKDESFSTEVSIFKT